MLIATDTLMSITFSQLSLVNLEKTVLIEC